MKPIEGGILTLLVVIVMTQTYTSATPGHVAPLDLFQHEPDPGLEIERDADRSYLWTLPNGSRQTLVIDLRKQGIDPADFDEIRFDLKPHVSQVGLNMILMGHPEPTLSSGWYLKFRTPTGRWSSGRFDLALDDDGLYRGQLDNPDDAGKLHIQLYPRKMGYPGEPVWRKASIRNVRFVKRMVSASFEVLNAEIIDTDEELAYIYPLRVQNRTDSEQDVRIRPDGFGTLRHFGVDVPQTTFALAPRESRTIPVRIHIPATLAMRLPPLYSEPIIPVVNVAGIEDSDVYPLMGYRPWPMWASVPLTNARPWEPATFVAFLDAREKALPSIHTWRRQIIDRADRALPHRWPVPDFGPPRHDQGYRCHECRQWLAPVTPTSLHHHHCTQCGREFKNDPKYDRAWLMRYNAARAQDVRSLALAWLLTDESRYADKAKKILLDYAEGYPDMSIVGTRSTSGATRLGANSLHSSYVIPAFAEGYWYLSASSVLDDVSRGQITDMLHAMGRGVIRHSVEYSNQQAEHFRAYGSVGLATRFWPFAAEAIYGDFGFHELVEYGYSADGIAHEGGAYHRAVYSAMNELAAFALEMDVNLYTRRFKRVFDGSLQAGAVPVGSPFYELAYRAYRDPTYLPQIEHTRRHVGHITALHGVSGVPEVAQLPVHSVHMAGAGYIYLKKGTAAEYTEIALNYIKQFDRHEHDRFTTFFRRSGRQIDSTVGRITYSSPRSAWMYHTAAHNTIVIDGRNAHAREGRLVAFDPSPEHPMAVVATRPESPLYDGIEHMRGIALIEDAYVVFDRIRSDRPCTIDRYQYGRGEASLSLEQPASFDSLQWLPKAGQFHSITGGGVGSTAHIGFANGLRGRLVSDGDMALYRAITVGGYQADPIEVTFARRTAAEDAVFIATFSFGHDHEPPAAEILDTARDDLQFLIRTDTTRYLIAVDVGQNRATIQQAESP